MAKNVEFYTNKMYDFQILLPCRANIQRRKYNYLCDFCYVLMAAVFGKFKQKKSVAIQFVFGLNENVSQICHQSDLWHRVFDTCSH